MPKTILIAMFAVATASASYADQCMDEAETQSAMNACAQQAYQASDEQLNKNFHEIRQRLGDDTATRNLLRDAERAWIAFRDAECSFAASATAGGSAYAMVYDMCLADLTQERVKNFRNYLECEEGDMSCPLPPAN